MYIFNLSVWASVALHKPPTPIRSYPTFTVHVHLFETPAFTLNLLAKNMVH